MNTKEIMKALEDQAAAAAFDAAEGRKAFISKYQPCVVCKVEGTDVPDGILAVRYHKGYYAVADLKDLAERAGLKIRVVGENDLAIEISKARPPVGESRATWESGDIDSRTDHSAE